MITLPFDRISLQLIGILSNNKRDDVMFQINNEIYVEMERKDVSIWATESSYRYICIMRFKNFMGTILAEVRCSEEKIYEMLDAFEQFFSFGMDAIPIPLETTNKNDNYQMIRLERIYDDTPSEADPILFSICSYSRETEQIITKFCVMMKEDDFLSNFCYLIYFSFLIDIDQEKGIPPIMY